tara:strand:+ start:338 stop:859 length:522 start_codon:yes stop_codon:yes gene_type:complete
MKKNDVEIVSSMLEWISIEFSKQQDKIEQLQQGNDNLKRIIAINESERDALALANEMDDESIARVCHEVNRALCEAFGDTSQPSWEDAPPWQKESGRMGVAMHRAADVGPEANHVAWMVNKKDEGWKYGPVKDPEKKEHPCMVPFGDLPPEQQAKDYVFLAVVNALKDGMNNA